MKASPTRMARVILGLDSGMTPVVDIGCGEMSYIPV